MARWPMEPGTASRRRTAVHGPRSALVAARGTIRRATWRERDLTFRNVEGLGDYDFVLPARRSAPGISAMLRVKNEERKIVMCLSSILSLFDEIVVVDNGSTDDTPRLVEEFKSLHDDDDRIRIFEYPHTVARCGDPHWATPEDSVHNLAYFYNWSRSRCTRTYYFKWDADMVVASGCGGKLRELFASVGTGWRTIWSVRVQTIYRAPDGLWYRGLDDVYREVRLAPNCSAVRYEKDRYWERLRYDYPIPRWDFEPVCIYELKDVAEAEFDHWQIDSFPAGGRKEREWLNFQAVKAGLIDAARFEPLPDDFAEALV